MVDGRQDNCDYLTWAALNIISDLELPHPVLDELEHCDNAVSLNSYYNLDILFNNDEQGYKNLEGLYNKN